MVHGLRKVASIAMVIGLNGVLTSGCGSGNQGSQLSDFKSSEPSLPQTLYLAVGGGPSVNYSQGVLEMNLELHDQAALRYQIDPGLTTRLFAGGNSQVEDIVFVADHPDPELRALGSLLEIDCVGCQTRSNQLPSLDDKASKSALENWLAQAATKIESNDRFRLYFSGHGAPNPHDFFETYNNNVAALWDMTFIDNRDFAANLAKINPEAETQVVMVQCFSGGFANFIYEAGNPELGLTSSNQCGFFSQVKDRPAAGCSPDLLEREEYSPYFFAAYLGKNESGQAVDADYNGNGSISSDEAHAYVAIAENSIDLPIKTSDVLLRDKSILSQELVDQTLNDATISSTLALMDATQQKVFASLLATLGLDLLALDHSERTTELTNGLLDPIQARYDALSPRFEESKGHLKATKKEIVKLVKAEAKRLGITKASTLGELIAVREILQQNSAFSAYVHAHEELDEVYDLVYEEKLLSVKQERLVYLIESVWRRHVLLQQSQVQDALATAVKKLDQLEACEKSSYF